MTKLKKLRKDEFIPDISYDLDGDGVVGGWDLVISKIFDKENKGRLTSDQRQSALIALSKVMKWRLS